MLMGRVTCIQAGCCKGKKERERDSAVRLADEDAAILMLGNNHFLSYCGSERCEADLEEEGNQ